tara:strand:+ start:609 stop:836 length:228 start_codon:yes stop_codon:yes gene_type:complete
VIGIGQNNNVPVDKITENNNLPWVKANDNCDVWLNWEAQNRDLFILNKDNEIIEKINLTESFDETQIRFIIEGIR